MQEPVLAALLAEHGVELAFNIVEIGALPVDGETPPFHALLEVYPASRISALEIDPALCDTLNREAPPGLRYYPCALGSAEETRPLYETAHPMCTSLYEPDERVPQLFGAMAVMALDRRSEIDTVALDTFVSREALGPVDFLKLDIQGAELDVMRGGAQTLASVLAIVCEVEFMPLYRNQPLYGDVDLHLRGRGFMLHRFLRMGGRVMKPVVRQGTSTYPGQLMWADAFFTRDLFGLDALSGEQRLKLAVLFDLYDSKDVALHLLEHCGVARAADVGERYFEHFTRSGVWGRKPG